MKVMTKGQSLLDYVCTSLNLLERDYFGLRYLDRSGQRHWLDPTKNIHKQIKGMFPFIFCFRVKFYPPEPHKLKEELTRYQIYLQLRRDLVRGRLYCSQGDAALLSAYILQSELGDFDPDEHMDNYVTEFKLLFKQTKVIEEKVAEIHQTQLRGQVPATAESNFLRKACLLDTYGVDPHQVKDHKRNQLFLGVNHTGILSFQGSKKTHHFKWADIHKINYESKMFIIHLVLNDKKCLIGFKCQTGSACAHLWKCAVEQRLFFTMHSSKEVPSVCKGGGLFARGTKFRYSGRVEREISEESKGINRVPPRFVRSRTLSLRHKSSTLPTPSKEFNESDLVDENYVNHSTPIAVGLLPDDSILEESSIFPEETIAELKEEPVAPSENHVQEEKPFIEEVIKPDSFVLESAPIFSNHVNKEEVATRVNVDKPNPTSDDLKLLRQEIPSNPITVKYSSPKKQGYLKLFIHAFIFAVIFVFCLTILVLESDSEVFREVRKIPEIIFLRRMYYDPAKDYINGLIWS
ncbi:FERM domain-containing protein 3 [Nymphon striatum]|nr:FERM domain-containing protein 3 [Nymphon striatum]